MDAEQGKTEAGNEDLYSTLRRRVTDELGRFGESIAYLDRCERTVATLTVTNHSSEIENWLRFQALLCSGLLGDYVFSTDERDLDMQQCRRLQLQLIGLACNAANTAIGLLVEGAYNEALSAIRHMSETFFHIAYVEIDQTYHKQWYLQADPNFEAPAYKRVDTIVDELKAAPPLDLDQAVIAKMHASWTHLCKGAHPSGEGITLTTREGDRFDIGTQYDRDFVIDAISHGTNAMKNLALELHEIKPQSDDWGEQLFQATLQVQKWTRRVQQFGREEKNRRRRAGSALKRAQQDDSGGQNGNRS